MKIDQLIIKDNRVDLIIRYNDMYPHRCNSVTFYTFAKLTKITIDNIEYDQIANPEDVDKGLRIMLAESFASSRIKKLIHKVNQFLATPPGLDE